MSDNFVLTGESVSESEPLQYRGCGLDGIFLLNGFTRETHDGEEYVSIKDIDGLHWAIGKHLAIHRKVLAPKEIKFLRKTMDLTQAELASALGKNSQSVARWEKGVSDIPATAEKLLRALFLAHTMNDDELDMLRHFLTRDMDALDSMDEVEVRPVQFTLDERWTDKHAA